MRKKAFITGASEGLGRTFALELAKDGYDTTVIARNTQRLQELVQELNTLGGEHQFIAADLGKDEGIALCKQALETTHYDLLINNAGISQFGQFRESDIDFEHMIHKVNCLSLMDLSITYLQQAKAGDAIINLSSLTYYMPTPIQPTYVATKNFIGSFSESLWFQERSRGVYVQGLCPGVTKTEFMNRSSNLEGFKKQFIDAISSTPKSVVRSSIKALDKRKGPIIIPGLANKLIALFMRLAPRLWTVWLVGKIGNLAE